MFETIILVIILCVCAVNLITSLEQNDIPQHNAMDKYNKIEALEQEVWDIGKKIDDINTDNTPLGVKGNKYNALDAYNDIEIVVERLKKLEDASKYHIQSTDDEYVSSDDIAKVLRSLREVVEDVQERLTILEDKFTYHIQSTDELKPKA